MFDADIVEEIWVNTTEAAAITGYNKRHIERLANRFWKQPEDERPIKVLNRLGRYELWLPDLISYLSESGHGPQRKRTHNP